ncbi:Eco47II family restriction endonuclease [Xenorhabdus bovienii]|uniref:Eco47II family restriction endonuclease n=1 Tax=Xenorhabdus bovienii TaxID=40576 RepID=UPI0023B2B7CF|nr:Eco47II family restriction endonuclease [Xenorhabdus bovienii]MDE9474992.1 Eco47II family restriction endonuclease [Xenorhabdus bovienii]
MSTFDKDKIKEILEPIITQAYEAQSTESDLRRNTLDVFSASIDSAVRGISLDEWKEQERQRQMQKTLQNQIGELHQEILGTLDGVTNLGTGQVVDLEGDGFIAEIKNKHNTTKGNHKIAIYDDLQSRLDGKDEDTKAYYVEILPKNGKSYDRPFTPSDNKTNERREEDPRIRQIDGQSFYEMVTGNKNALRELYELLPVITTEIINEKYGKDQNADDYIDESEFDHIYKKPE